VITLFGPIVHFRREKLKFEPNEEVDLIPHHLLRKYIAYARQYVSPVLSPAAAEVIKKYYLMLRVKHRTVDATPVTTRQLESLLRLTQVKNRRGSHAAPPGKLPCLLINCVVINFVYTLKARAKLELREIATEGDARDVLEIFEFGMAGIFEDDVIAGTSLSELVGSVGSRPGTSRTQTKGMVKPEITFEETIQCDYNSVPTF